MAGLLGNPPQLDACCACLPAILRPPLAEALAGHLAYREPARATGVYVCVSQLEYARISLESGGALNTYYATGAHLSVTSGKSGGTCAQPGQPIPGGCPCT